MVARMNRLPEAELERFLFGWERIPLDPVRRPLRELQENRCFYCDGRMAGAADVDHFIPWSRYPDDTLDNLVAAHPRCNNSKRDFLAAVDHPRTLDCAAPHCFGSPDDRGVLRVAARSGPQRLGGRRDLSVVAGDRPALEVCGGVRPR